MTMEKTGLLLTRQINLRGSLISLGLSLLARRKIHRGGGECGGEPTAGDQKPALTVAMKPRAVSGPQTEPAGWTPSLKAQ